LVSSASLAQLFGLFKDRLECVLLNACYSEVQAEAIHQQIDCVIGMNQAIGDRAAIKFAVGFYDALGVGRDYADAFEFGRNAINLEGIPEVATPVLRQRPRRSHPSDVQRPELELTEGTMSPGSFFYVERPGDKVALSTIQQQGVTLTIKGPRQMGKSSLLMRVIDAAINAGKQVAYLDFQLFDQEAIADAEVFYCQFCMVLTEKLGLSERLGEYWQGAGNNQRCTRYMENYVLKKLDGPLVLAMDEVDRMFDAEFRSDFFSMLRSWHNNRALPMSKIWKQFDLALVTATEPYHLITNLNQSPFNVGETVSLSDFTLEQVVDLNERHGSLLTVEQLEQLYGLLNGHPYLVRRALFLVGSQRLGFAELLEQATQDRGPFGDHLRYHLLRIYNNKELVQGLLQVIRGQMCSDERIARLLTAAGLIRGEGQRYMPRCPLYADYFGEHLG
jgi:hypothetical protein